MLYLIAILLPPLAVALTNRAGAFIANLFLCLLFWIPGIIHAILVVNQHYQDKRTDRVVSAIERQGAKGRR